MGLPPAKGMNQAETVTSSYEFIAIVAPAIPGRNDGCQQQ